MSKRIQILLILFCSVFTSVGVAHAADLKISGAPNVEGCNDGFMPGPGEVRCKSTVFRKDGGTKPDPVVVVVAPPPPPPPPPPPAVRPYIWCMSLALRRDGNGQVVWVDFLAYDASGGDWGTSEEYAGQKRCGGIFD